VAKQAKRERQRLNREARRQAELAATRRRKQMRMARNIGIVAVPLIIVFVILQVRSSGGSGEPTREFSKRGAVTLASGMLYTASIDTSEGKMLLNLDTGSAPESVKNFVFLARKHFYDGLTFHRVAKDFVIQGGDPKADGSGGPGYQTQVETPANGYQVGSVAWAKGQQDPPGTAGSQFFIVTSEAPAPGQGLDALNQQPYQYGIIGSVTDAQSLDVARKIGTLVPPRGDGKPTKKVTIKKVTIVESAEPTLPSEPATAPPSS
jgi:cyclophilin family peptidyl-prolyl cis-trans isomerase